jgi:osmotically-inducible protein OsmY
MTTNAPTGTNGVTDRVLHALQSDPRTMESVIDASFEQGAVTLSGKVDSYDTREAAFEIARRQDGVITVINDLKVK